MLIQERAHGALFTEKRQKKRLRHHETPLGAAYKRLRKILCQKDVIFPVGSGAGAFFVCHFAATGSRASLLAGVGSTGGSGEICFSADTVLFPLKGISYAVKMTSQR